MFFDGLFHGESDLFPLCTLWICFNCCLSMHCNLICRQITILLPVAIIVALRFKEIKPKFKAIILQHKPIFITIIITMCRIIWIPHSQSEIWSKISKKVSKTMAVYICTLRFKTNAVWRSNNDDGKRIDIGICAKHNFSAFWRHCYHFWYDSICSFVFQGFVSFFIFYLSALFELIYVQFFCFSEINVTYKHHRIDKDSMTRLLWRLIKIW